ncbi:MAG: hypothetical protein GY772_09445, partial [bacterium]|nr:hypothetical protein [bacterium]
LTQPPAVVDLLTQVSVPPEVGVVPRSRLPPFRPPLVDGVDGFPEEGAVGRRQQALAMLPAAALRSSCREVVAVESGAALAAPSPLLRPSGVALRAALPRGKPRICRYGRCYECQRAMRPGVTPQGEPYLSCSFNKGPGQHTFRRIGGGEARRLGFPARMVRKVRVAF